MRPFWRRPARAVIPELQCEYCFSTFRWRMEIANHAIYVCEQHVNQALDEFNERKKK